MSRSLKILLTNSTDIYGGGEFYVYELAKALQERDHQVLVSCRSDNLLCEKCEKAHIRTIPLEFPPRGQLVKFISRVRRIIKDNHIQIVHTNSNYDRTAGAFAALTAGVKHITNVHSFHSLQHNITHWFRNRYATDHYIVDGVCVKDLLIRKDRIPSSKISVVYLGVNPDEMKRDQALREKVRKEFGFTDQHLVVGNVARLVLFKGQEFLLRAFAESTHQFKNARLVIVGDGELQEMLTSLARTIDIEKFVIFTGFRHDLQAIYSAFDIYVHSSFEGGGETFPFAVLQALAQELPVIVTRVGDVPVMVEEGLNGFVVPDRDASAIAQKLSILLSDEYLRQSMAMKSRERLLQRFTLRSMVDHIEKIYFSVLYKEQSR